MKKEQVTVLLKTTNTTPSFSKFPPRKIKRVQIQVWTLFCCGSRVVSVKLLAMNKQTQITVLCLLDELYEKRAEVSLKRIQDELSSAELRVLEGEFDAYFRRTVSKIENYINQE